MINVKFYSSSSFGSECKYSEFDEIENIVIPEECIAFKINNVMYHFGERITKSHALELNNRNILHYLKTNMTMHGIEEIVKIGDNYYSLGKEDVVSRIVFLRKLKLNKIKNQTI
jgi:hypothetical protein